MKKTTVLFSMMLLAGLVSLPNTAHATGIPGRAPLLVPTAASPAPVPAAPQEKKPQWKGGRAEYDAFQAFVKESSPQKRIPLIQAFIKKYPKSDFLASAYVAEMQTYAQLNQTSKAIASAKQALETDPDNLLPLYYLSFTFPYTFKASAPDAQTELSQGAQYARHGLEVLQSMQKPDGVSQEKFENEVKTDRAVFNISIGFAALQQKNYSQAIKALEAAAQDEPKNVLIYSFLGQAYYNESPREINKAIWHLARATALAQQSNSPNVDQLKKSFSQVYEARHGSNAGADQVLAQASSSATMPADFSVAPPPQHPSTGNPNLDAFYKIEDSIAVGGDTAQQNWSQLKGQPLGLVGHVDSVEKGTDPNTYLVRVDITPQSRSQEGTYDIVLQDSQANAKYLEPGDPLRFQGTIEAYSATPNFNLTLSDAKIDESVLKSAHEKALAAAQAAKEKKASRPRR
jgi:tetratricopeptide (TPR) repeat protein